MPRYITHNESRGFGPVRGSHDAAERDSFRRWKRSGAPGFYSDHHDKVYAVDTDGYLRDENGALVYSNHASTAPGILLRIDKDAIASDDGTYDEIGIEDASNLRPIRLPDGLWYFKVWGKPIGPFKTLDEVEQAINQTVRDDELKRYEQCLRDSRKPAWLTGLLDLVLMLLLVLIGFQIFKWLK